MPRPPPSEQDLVPVVDDENCCPVELHASDVGADGVGIRDADELVAFDRADEAERYSKVSRRRFHDDGFMRPDDAASL